MRDKTFTLIVSLLLFVVATACGQAAPTDAQNTENIAAPALPEGAMQFDYDSHLHFDAVIRDSIPARLVFDTGNTNLLLDSTFYAEHFASQGTLRKAFVGGAGGKLEVSYLDVSKWSYSVGGHAATDNTAVVLNLRKILGNEVSGMFGMEFVRGRKVELNYADSYLRFVSDEPDSSYTRVDCKWLDDTKTRLLASVKISDGTTSREGWFMVDLGSSGTLSINSGSVAKMGVQGLDARKMIYAVGGVGGSRTDHLIKLANVELGGHRISDLRANYSGNSAGALADKRYDGLIGNELLERFNVVFDFAECRMWVRPNRNFDSPSRYLFGVALTPHNDHWVVNGLLEGGKADRAGVKRGDKILTINDKSPAEMSKAERKALVRTREPWRVTIDRNGTPVEIVIECEE